MIGELDTCSEFMDCIRFQRKMEMDTVRFQQQVVQIAKDMIDKDPAIGAFYWSAVISRHLRRRFLKETGLPVFDFIAMADLMYRALVPRTY